MTLVYELHPKISKFSLHQMKRLNPCHDLLMMTGTVTVVLNISIISISLR